MTEFQNWFLKIFYFSFLLIDIWRLCISISKRFPSFWQHVWHVRTYLAADETQLKARTLFFPGQFSHWCQYLQLADSVPSSSQAQSWPRPEMKVGGAQNIHICLPLDLIITYLCFYLGFDWVLIMSPSRTEPLYSTSEACLVRPYPFSTSPKFSGTR